MKNIKLNFNCNNIYVIIYDGNKKVYEGSICGSELYIKLEKCKAYRLVAYSYLGILKTSFFVNNRDSYYFSFINRNNETLITFYLTDYYYKNLPIERGEIILWQK